MAKKIALPEWATNQATKDYWRTVAPSAGMAAWGTVEEQAPPVVAYCSTCGNAGFVRVGAPQPGAAWVQPEYISCPDPSCTVRREALGKLYGAVNASSQIPLEYRKMTFAKWEKLMQKAKPKDAMHVMDKKRDAFGAALAFVHAHEQGFKFSRAEAAINAGLAPVGGAGDNILLNSIVFSGTFGVGKTSLACAIANALMELYIQVVYVRMDSLFLALRDTYNTEKKGETEGKVLSLYKSAPVLILDELPLTASDWQRKVGGDLIDHRLANGLPTLITTNMEGADQLQKAWGRLIADRITAMSHWFVLGGVQLRPRYAERESR